MKAIEFRDVTVEYEHRTALKDVSFDVEQGEFIGVVGSNGSGKTTMLKTILGLVQPAKGEIRIFGKELHSNLHEIRGKIG